MLAVWLFVVFWVVLGVALFLVAMRGGLGAAREIFHAQTRGGRKLFGISFVVIYIGFGLALPAVLLVGNHSNASAQVGGIKLTNAEKTGRELFGQHCGFCHTLAAANAVGKIGPNLDTLQPAQSLIMRTILNGCLQNPPVGSPQTCLGNGTMPSNIVQGRQAVQVAQFVAAVAGKE